MVTDRERRLVQTMVRLRLWRIDMWMRIPSIVPCLGTRWLLQWLKDRQIVDDWHHAPCCPANHYHRARLVFQGCTCGAAAARLV